MHMLIWLYGDSKKNLNANVDKYVSAEIPDPEIDPLDYNVVARHMIHRTRPLWSREHQVSMHEGHEVYKTLPQEVSEYVLT